MSAKLPQTTGRTRLTKFPQALWLLLLLLWTMQVWRPQLSYPDTGPIQVTVLALLVVASGAVARFKSPFSPNAALAGLCFLGYAFVRWAVQGFPTVGADNFGTLAVTGAYATAACFLSRALPARWQVSTLLYAFLGVGLATGLHGVCQYYYLYDRSLAALRLDLQGVAEPTPLQIALLHHFQVKRVASIWGDPNTYGAFLAVSILSAVALCHMIKLVKQRSKILDWSLCAAVMIMAAAGIVLSGSRGAILDVVVGVAVYVIVMRRAASPLVRAATVAGAVIFLLIARPSEAQNPVSSALTRSNTIRERVHYVNVGTQIFLKNPVFGSGLGAVDRMYGRFKPAEAREAKYLHNWVLQIAAEMGIIGVLLAGTTVVLLLRNCFRTRTWETITVGTLASMIVFDALLQHSYNQRELMSLFGLLLGIGNFPPFALQSSSLQPAVGRRSPVPLLLVALLAVFVVPALSGKLFLERASDALEAGDPAEATALLRKAERWAPRNPQVPMMLASIDEQQGRADAALTRLLKARSLQPESASVRAQLARLYLRLNRLQESRVEIEEALRLYPTNPEYHYDLARIRETSGDIPGALKSARDAARFGYLYVNKYKAYIEQLERKSSTP